MTGHAVLSTRCSAHGGVIEESYAHRSGRTGTPRWRSGLGEPEPQQCTLGNVGWVNRELNTVRRRETTVVRQCEDVTRGIPSAEPLGARRRDREGRCDQRRSTVAAQLCLEAWNVVELSNRDIYRAGSRLAHVPGCEGRCGRGKGGRDDGGQCECTDGGSGHEPPASHAQRPSSLEDGLGRDRHVDVTKGLSNFCHELYVGHFNLSFSLWGQVRLEGVRSPSPSEHSRCPGRCATARLSSRYQDRETLGAQAPASDALGVDESPTADRRRSTPHPDLEHSVRHQRDASTGALCGADATP